MDQNDNDNDPRVKVTSLFKISNFKLLTFDIRWIKMTTTQE